MPFKAKVSRGFVWEPHISSFILKQRRDFQQMVLVQFKLD